VNIAAPTIHRIVNEPIPSNCFVVYNKAFGNECLIIDPGSNDEKDLVEYITQERLTPRYIILTHEHFDHCLGVNFLVAKYGVDIVCSEHCSVNIKSERLNNSYFYEDIRPFCINSKTISIESLGMKLLFGGTEMRFYSAPGHTDAGIIMTFGKNLFTGDTLLKGIKTFTKLRSGSNSKLRETISKIRGFQGLGYIVYPGHGDSFELDNYELDLSL